MMIGSFLLRGGGIPAGACNSPGRLSERESQKQVIRAPADPPDRRSPDHAMPAHQVEREARCCRGRASDRGDATSERESMTTTQAAFTPADAGLPVVSPGPSLTAEPGALGRL